MNKFLNDEIKDVKKKKEALKDIKEHLKSCICGKTKKMVERKCNDCEDNDESTRDYRRVMKEIRDRELSIYQDFNPKLLELKKICHCGIYYTRMNCDYCTKCSKKKCKYCGEIQSVCNEFCVNKCDCGKVINEKYTQCYNCIKKCKCGKFINGNYKQCFNCYKK
jgi:hypothetical protein